MYLKLKRFRLKHNFNHAVMECKNVGGTETLFFVVFQGGNYLWPV